mgnify:CR=1 FL=1
MSYDPLFKAGDLLVYKDCISGPSARSATLLVVDPKPDAGNRIGVWVEGDFAPKRMGALSYPTSSLSRVFQTYLQHPGGKESV